MRTDHPTFGIARHDARLVVRPVPPRTRPDRMAAPAFGLNELNHHGVAPFFALAT